MLKITTDPETQQVLQSMIMMNMEGEGIGDVRKYFRKRLLKMGVVEPTEQEAKDLQEELANTPPTPQDEYLRSAAANEQQKAVKAQAETIKTQAQTDQIRSDITKTMTEIDAKQQEQAMEVIEKLGPRVTPPNAPGSKIEE